MDAKIKISISEALASKKDKGKGKSGKLDKYSDFEAADAMVVSDNMHLFPETVRAPPGLNSRSVFHQSGQGQATGRDERQSRGVQGQVQVQGQERQGE